VKETHLHFNTSTCGLVDHSSTNCFSALNVCRRSWNDDSKTGDER
jgi:hypothetical protein